MTDLDSRILGYTDCFGQRFTAVGTHPYRLRIGGGFSVPSEDGQDYKIQVAGKKAGEQRQHHVKVSIRDGRLLAEPARLEIAPGDIVTWGAESGVPGYVVEGGSGQFRFSSAELAHESVYFHSFGQPGTYRWIDSRRGKLGGEVEVRDVRPANQAEFDDWLKQLEQGSLVHVKTDQVSPTRVKLPVGGTVCWTIEGDARISVTDIRLVHTNGPPADNAERAED